MIKYFLNLLIGCSLAWSVDILYTPGLNNTLGLTLLFIFIIMLVACMYDSYRKDEVYYKVVLFNAEIFIGFILTLLFFFIDKFSDMTNHDDYKQYILPVGSMFFSIPWTVAVIVMMRREAKDD
ncbi:hypothetical protein IFU33_07645 [Pantoea agglomerans]|uniref:hypothetical protein n=1 Tax=Enterobacter agglomerans TaxID=549 RepID=UPI00178518DA|nr:hypothetical protein [Pantoea agglomerans]WVJ47854.1 hypothetical protein IFU33_07645 [Pantoea agglomerans]